MFIKEEILSKEDKFASKKPKQLKTTIINDSIVIKRYSEASELTLPERWDYSLGGW